MILLSRSIFGVLLFLISLGQAQADVVFTGSAVPCLSGKQNVQLNVEVSGVRSDDGIVTVTVYGDNPSDFLASGKKLARARISARRSVTDVCLAVPQHKSYAIAVYHDENNDHHFNRNFIGYPTEGYGVSNDGLTLIGIPSYDEARFTAHPGVNKISIPLRY